MGTQNDEQAEATAPDATTGPTSSSARKGGRQTAVPVPVPAAPDAPSGPSDQSPSDQADDAPQRDAEVATFTRERLLGPEGPTIAGHPAHVIVGALDGTDAETYTREEIQEHVDAFLARPVEQED